MHRPLAALLGVLALLAWARPAPAADAPAPAPRPPALPDPAPWLDAKGASLAGVSDDGAVVLLRMTSDGVTQVFRVGRDGGWPRRLTFRREGVDFVVLSPDGRWMVLGYDHGGDENHDLVLRSTDPEGPPETVLVSAPGVQHGTVAWSREGDRVFYRSNAEDRAHFHLYERRLADGATRAVLARKGTWSVEDAAPGGGRLLVAESRGVSHRVLHVLDLAAGTLAPVDPQSEGRPADAGDGWFVTGGAEVAFLSDRGGEWRQPWVARLSDGTVRPLDAPAADVDGLSVGPDGRTAYLVWNDGGRGRLLARDLATGAALPVPDTGDGVVSGIAADRRGHVWFSLGRAEAPEAVWRWDPGAAEAVQATWPDMAGLSPAQHAFTPRLVTYPSFDGRAIPAWLYLPQGREPRGLPFVVTLHGGPASQERPWFNGERAYLLSLGYGVLAPNVRGSSGYGRSWERADDYRNRPVSVKDAKAGADWLEAQGLADPKRIAVTGGSYGGYLVLALLTEHPDRFAAGAESVGIANFESFLERTAPYRRANRESEYGPLSDREFLRSISPIHRVDRIRAPLLISHGMNDPRVPVGEARQIEEALKARGQAVEAIYWRDEGHGLSQRSNRRAWARRLADFLGRHLAEGR